MSFPNNARPPAINFAWVILGLWIFVVLLILVTWAWSEYVPDLRWMQDYTSAGGIACCSELDCRRVPVSLVALHEDKTLVKIRGVSLLLPAQSVHQSEDGETWWCCKTDSTRHCPLEPTVDNTRCAFWAVGS